MQTGDEQPEEVERGPEAEQEGGEVVDLSAKRLSEWLRGTFGGKRLPPPSSPR